MFKKKYVIGNMTWLLKDRKFMVFYLSVPLLHLLLVDHYLLLVLVASTAMAPPGRAFPPSSLAKTGLGVFLGTSSLHPVHTLAISCNCLGYPGDGKFPGNGELVYCIFMPSRVPDSW